MLRRIRDLDVRAVAALQPDELLVERRRERPGADLDDAALRRRARHRASVDDAVVAVEDGARHPPGSEALDARALLQAAVRLLDLGADLLGRKLDADLLLDRAQVLDGDLHGHTTLRPVPYGSPPPLTRMREGGLEPPTAVSGLDPKSSASTSSATLARARHAPRILRCYTKAKHARKAESARRRRASREERRV